MLRYLALIAVAAMLSGCAGATLPSSAQIEANVPQALLTCPGIPSAPNSPTNRATAKYIIKLYDTAVVCKRHNGEVASLLQQYAGEIAKYKRMLKREGK